jgi:hypothetical protein
MIVVNSHLLRFSGKAALQKHHLPFWVATIGLESIGYESGARIKVVAANNARDTATYLIKR